MSLTVCSGHFLWGIRWQELNLKRCSLFLLLFQKKNWGKLLFSCKASGSALRLDFSHHAPETFVFLSPINVEYTSSCPVIRALKGRRTQHQSILCQIPAIIFSSFFPWSQWVCTQGHSTGSLSCIFNSWRRKWPLGWMLSLDLKRTWQNFRVMEFLARSDLLQSCQQPLSKSVLWLDCFFQNWL